MTTCSFTFRLICPRIVNISYLWAHDRWRHIRPRGQAGCLASLVELLLFLWNKTRSCVLTLQSRSRFPARHCCPVQPLIPAAGIPVNLGRRQSKDLSQAAWDIPLPHTPIIQFYQSLTPFKSKPWQVCKTWTALKTNQTKLFKAAANISLQINWKIQGRFFPFSNDTPEPSPEHGGWNFRQIHLANSFHLGYS